jgi:hypothetical protein
MLIKLMHKKLGGDIKKSYKMLKARRVKEAFCLKLMQFAKRCNFKIELTRGMGLLVRVTRLGNFSPIGLLWDSHYDFLKRRSSPK